ncbi:chitinase [Aeromonas veronii]|uniref:glycoside hydrolase family 19 protein n=1 Tax=Aeromonas veronii TaxID=654 RepID=UPI00214DBA3C|nr:glycoside hydrolase family 19 protein [Aeromonas veronii]MCR3972888.1 chitinase [Aeromonas veronii]MCR3977242.1 chitinase [Aeromonas veronii]
MKKNRITLLLAGMMLSGHLWAAEAYDINKSYPGGSQVNYNGQVFEAKWWVNPGQTPGMAAANEWDTPWKLVGEGEVTPPDTGGDDKPNPPTPTPPDGSTTPVYMSQAELDAKEKALTDFPAMEAVKASIATRDNLVVEAVLPGRADNPGNVKRVESLLSESQFNYLFPLRAPEYTYRGLLQAAAKFPALCSDYSDGRDADAICRKTLATMFAHFAQETGGHENWRPEAEWRQALVYVREMGWNETMRGGYNAECRPDVWQGQQWPCGTFDNGEFKSYFGRGAKQLSYNYNYGPFSEAMFGTVRTLLDRPDLVADTWLNLASAVFFYTYPQPPKPSMLHVIDGTWQPNDHDKQNGLVPGFGVTTQIINGGVECGGPVEHAQSQNRINYYREFANYLGVAVPSDEVLGCKNMKVFDDNGAGALPIYWEQDWSYVAENPNGGKSYACKLVGYQTRFSAFKAGDYSRCVQHFYPEVVIEDNGGGTNLPPVANITGPAQAEGGSKVTLSGQHSSDPEGKPLSYAWTIPAGASAPALDQVTLELTLPKPASDTKLEIKLTVTDEGNLSRSATHSLLVKGEEGGVTPPDYPTYKEGTPYKAGERVSSGGASYECKPHPYTGWCAGAAWAYEPGKGTAWADAWIKL